MHRSTHAPTPPLFRAAALALSLTVTATSTALPAGAQGLPKASIVLAKHVAAIGGQAAVTKVTSMKQVATMELPSMGLSASMEMLAAAPNRTMMKAVIGPVGEIVQGFDGTVGFDVNPMQGPRLLTGTELQQASENADFYATLLFPASTYATMETEADEAFNGEAAYRVKLVRASGRATTHWFSKASGLMIGSQATAESAMGSITSTTRMSDYKAFGGVLFPTRIAQEAGPQQINITITEVQVNAVPDSAFALPAAVKALVKP